MKPNLKKHTAIAVGFVGSLLWGATCVLENQSAPGIKLRFGFV